jgi:putative oxidoreductase
MMKIESMNTEAAKAAAVEASGNANPVREAHTRFRSTVVVLGRVCFSLIFIAAGLSHFSARSIELAATQGVPFASIAVPFSGILALAGGLSILLGYRAKLGAWLLVLFLTPVTLAVHRFWGIADPILAHEQMIMFMKNVSMLGGALIISQFGAGPFSLDARRSR